MREYEQATATDYVMSPGGDATLVAITLSSLGLKVGLSGSPVGDDPMGAYILKSLEKEGIHVMVPKLGKTAMTAIVLDKSKRSTITFHDNTPEEQIPIPDEITNAKYVYVDGCFGRNGAVIARTAREKGIKTLLNFDLPSAPYIGLYDAVIVNEKASKLFSDDPAEAVRMIYSENKSLVIVTLGEFGALCYDGTLREAPVFEVDPVDTTGAGAAFASGFIYSSLNGKTLDECLEFASAAGAYKTLTRGSYRKFTESDVLNLIKSH